jgi:hypothetical protein
VNATSAIEQIANAVLYEGFLLYPYRLSSVKNRHRWNFGVLYPEPFGGLNGERQTSQTQCLIEAGDHAALDVKVRFLQLVDGSPVEREVLAEDLKVWPAVRTNLFFPSPALRERSKCGRRKSALEFSK